jgi:hypothetical protein
MAALRHHRHQLGALGGLRSHRMNSSKPRPQHRKQRGNVSGALVWPFCPVHSMELAAGCMGGTEH